MRGLWRRLRGRRPAPAPPALLADRALEKLLAEYAFDRVLDLGFGSGEHARRLAAAGKRVTAISLLDSKEIAGFDGDVVQGDYLATEFAEPFDCIWASHVLEHQLRPHDFLCKLHRDLREGGVLAITVPPAKPNIVGGHVSLWNGGLLLYHLVLAGFDCSDARLARYGYNVSVLVRRSSFELPALGSCRGDLEALAAYLPPWLGQDADGDVERWNWDAPRSDCGLADASSGRVR